ncbi:hypothetical protein FB45DRAFT_886801 [Roridomyces roridus]|uniref:Restriction endonuclease domain-containing protein n=1 Tax=Roridomyces roridus TaxID=1738132 RepID=A0AAD7CIP6_9AGAR|nr:hypothetical protein FB45DRAFT_886801 [Roridomyces roridus]
MTTIAGCDDYTPRTLFRAAHRTTPSPSPSSSAAPSNRVLDPPAAIEPPQAQSDVDATATHGYSVPTFLAHVRDALLTDLNGVGRELSFAIPATVPLVDLLENLEKFNVEKDLQTLRISVTDGQLKIYQCMPNEEHESAGLFIVDLWNQLRDLNGGAYPEVKRVGSTQYKDINSGKAKQADGALRPKSRPYGALPSVVIEVGDSESRPSLYKDVDIWFNMQSTGPHRIKLVITVKIYRASHRIEVKFWERVLQRKAEAPHLATEAFPGLDCKRSAIVASIGNVTGISIPTRLIYDNAPGFVAGQPSVTVTSDKVQSWLVDLFEGL